MAKDLHPISKEDIPGIDPCRKYDPAAIEKHFAGRKTVTVLDIWDMNVLPQHKVRALLEKEAALVDESALIAEILGHIPKDTKIPHLVKTCRSAVGAVTLLQLHHEHAGTDPSEDLEKIKGYVRDLLS